MNSVLVFVLFVTVWAVTPECTSTMGFRLRRYVARPRARTFGGVVSNAGTVESLSSVRDIAEGPFRRTCRRCPPALPRSGHWHRGALVLHRLSLAYLEQGILPRHTQHVMCRSPPPPRGFLAGRKACTAWRSRTFTRGPSAVHRSQADDDAGDERGESATNCTRCNGGIASQSLLVEPIAQNVLARSQDCVCSTNRTRHLA